MKRREFLSSIKKTSLILPLVYASNALSKEIISPKDSISLLGQDIPIVKDVYLDSEYIKAMQAVRRKLSQVQRYVGYGNFNIISFDQVNYILRRARGMKPFTKEEVAFIEFIFYYKPDVHGFYGERINTNLTNKINKKDVKKIAYTGHYLFRGKPEETYLQLTEDIGKTLVLTSGVRSIVKQMKLFLDKVNSVKYNLSEASNSIAPPAFTYHSVGDFDVGKKGLGSFNFTARFALTPEFKEIKKLKYIDMRYTINNKDGVRYEPWHVKIV